MIWDKLVDRCLLFTDAPGGLLKELLKEGEMELSNRLEIYDSLYNLVVPSTTDGLGIRSHYNSSTMNVVENNYHKLPFDYLKDISVSHEGRTLRKMSEDEIARKQNGKSYSGTPTAYGISGDFIVFDTSPSPGDSFVIHYKAMMTDLTNNKVLTMTYYKSSGPYVYLDTDLGSNLDNKKMAFEGDVRVLTAGTNGISSSPVGVPALHKSNKSPADPGDMSSGVPVTVATRYTLTGGALGTSGSLSSSTLDGNGGLVMVFAYRDIAPVIPERFHKDLCNYAIAIANAKSAPDLYDKYWTKWELNMDRLINEAMDRDLIHSIRGEI